VAKNLCGAGARRGRLGGGDYVGGEKLQEGLSPFWIGGGKIGDWVSTGAPEVGIYAPESGNGKNPNAFRREKKNVSSTHAWIDLGGARIKTCNKNAGTKALF